MKMSADHEIKLKAAMSNVGGDNTMYRYTHINTTLHLLCMPITHFCIARQHELSHLLLTLGYTIETCV